MQKFTKYSKLYVAVVLLPLYACSDYEAKEIDDIQSDIQKKTVYVGDEKRQTVFGEDGIFGALSGNKEGGTGGGIGVNSFLWRATLDTISFLPINSADAFGGVILTDWYSPAETPEERFKLNIYILGRALRADGVKVSVFKQARDERGEWTSLGLGKNVSTDIENAILTRARQLRNATAVSE
ncbi:MAG: DUF3576 domain-containing protein [Alphaproteobacteria bacterium]|nr:DUF3576 domain-containing protein [Alphaproteobacteria bacterium]